MTSREALIAACAAGVLFATNPTTADYATWLGREALGSGPGGALVSIFGGPLIAENTKRDNWVLFSVFVTQIDDRNRLVTLGALRNFIPLSNPTAAPAGPPAPHIVSAGSPDNWLPEDGYVWVINPPVPGDLRVRWQIGRLSSQHPHIVAADAEGRWLPADGYAWIANPPPPGDFRVQWQPGRPSSLHPHIIAAKEEGHWLPQDGYAWLHDPEKAGGYYSVQWQPGHFSTVNPHIIAAPIEGQWLPENGYTWIVSPPVPGDLRVKPVGS